MGFSQQDLQEQLDRNKIRFGPRIQPRERLAVPYQGERPAVPANPKRPVGRDRREDPDDPGYERFQLRLF